MQPVKIHSVLDGGTPKSVAVGKGTCVLLRGSCRVDRHRIAGLRLLIDGVEAPITRFSEPRVKRDGAQRWWSVVDLPQVDKPRVAALEFEVRIGLRHRERTALGSVKIERGWRSPRLELSPGQPDIDGSVTGALGLRPLVAICVATSSPPIAEVYRFVNRMAKQSYENWICHIRDGGSSPEHLAALQKATEKDERVELRGASRAGRDRYSSVEEALMDAPAQAPYVVLAALEDSWSATSTLEHLVTGVASGANAVVGCPGRGSDVATGAASRILNLSSVDNLLGSGPIALRRELADYVLPLPPIEQNGGHPEWWLLQVASALGRVQYRTVRERDDEVVQAVPNDTRLGPRSETRLMAEVLTDRILQLRCGAFLAKQSRRRLKALEKARGQTDLLAAKRPTG